MLRYILYLINSYFNLYRSKKYIKKKQLAKLNKILIYAKKHIPMYRELYKNKNVEICNIDDLKSIPILEATYLRQQELSSITSEIVKKDDLILWGTSGSSGTPFQFYQLKDDAIKWQLTFLRFLFVNGFRLWWRVAVVMRDNPVKIDSLMGKLLTFRKNIIPINQPIEKQAELIVSIKPQIIYGITPAIEILADWMIEKRKVINSAKIVLGMGVMPTVEVSRKLMSAFGEQAKVISYYGANDCGSIGFYCSKCNLFHFEDDQVITEIVDGNNDQIVNGDSGRILITTLDRFATPLIRYDIGDMIKLPENAKKCKIKFEQFETLEGRVTDKLTLKNGNKIAYVHLWNVTMHLKNVKMIQFYQKNNGEVIIKFVPALNADVNEIENYILEKLSYKDQAQFSFQIVDDIPLEPSGKRKLLKREESL
jgi:phenylacetate-CoA ligase